MGSKAFEQIKAYLDTKEIKFSASSKDESKEKITFGMNGEVQQWFIFLVESEMNTVQFRSVQILDETDLKHYHDPSKKEHRIKLYEYLLECNYQWRLGKFALDPEDKELDLYFVISDFVEADKGIEEELLDRIWSIFIGLSIGPSSVEEAIKNIKHILATGEKLPEESTQDKLAQLLAGLKSTTTSDESDSPKKRSAPSAKADDLDDGI